MHKRLRSVSIAGLPCVRIAQKPEKGRWFAIIASKGEEPEFDDGGEGQCVFLNSFDF